MTKTEKVLNAFLEGNELSKGEIQNRFAVANPTAVVNYLRQNGYAIYLNKGGKDSRGRVRASRYRLGAPSRQVVAAGYKALARGLV
jgi:hypothetical protein